MSCRRALVTAGAVCLLLAVAAPTAVAQDAASVSMTGWWTRVPASSAPEGGFAVAQAPDGPTSVAAVGLMVLQDPESVTLVLTEDSVLGSPELRVCPTPNQWLAEEPGAWGDRPREECASGEVQLERNEGAGTWTADVTSLVIGDERQVSLMIVPAEEEGPLHPTFRATFSEASVTAPAAEGTATGAGAGGATPPAPSPTPSGGDTFTAPSPPPPAPAAPAPPASPQPHDAVPEDGGPDAGEDTDETDDQVAFSPGIPSRTTPISEDRPWGQAFFFVGLAALVGVAAGVGRRQLRTLGWVDG